MPRTVNILEPSITKIGREWQEIKIVVADHQKTRKNYQLTGELYYWIGRGIESVQISCLKDIQPTTDINIHTDLISYD